LTFHDLSSLQEIAQNSGAQGYVLKSEALRRADESDREGVHLGKCFHFASTQLFPKIPAHLTGDTKLPTDISTATATGSNSLLIQEMQYSLYEQPGVNVEL